jgi:hypothetical protein
MRTDPERLERLRQRTDRPVLAAAFAGVIATVFTLVRLFVAGKGKIASFIMAERAFANPALMPRGVPVLPDNGYDGQFFYRLALDPANLHRQAFGITLDNTFRLQRIGYPALSWLLSLGRHSWVPTTLVIVNILAISALALVGGFFARESSRHAMWGLLLAGYFGFVFSVSRDTAEPLAALCMLAGLLAYRRGRPVLAAAFFAYGVLTRETVLVAVGAIALTRVIGFVRRKEKPALAEVTWLAPVAAFVAWQFVVRSVTGNFPISQDAQDNSGSPIGPVVKAVLTHLRAAVHLKAANDIWALELLVLVFFVGLAITVLRSTAAPLHERTAFGAYIIELLFLSPIVWNGVSDLRSLNEVFALSVVVLLGTARRSLWPLAATLTPVLAIVMAHRIVSL